MTRGKLLYNSQSPMVAPYSMNMSLPITFIFRETLQYWQVRHISLEKSLNSQLILHLLWCMWKDFYRQSTGITMFQFCHGDRLVPLPQNHSQAQVIYMTTTLFDVNLKTKSHGQIPFLCLLKKCFGCRWNGISAFFFAGTPGGAAPDPWNYLFWLSL